MLDGRPAQTKYEVSLSALSSLLLSVSFHHSNKWTGEEVKPLFAASVSRFLFFIPLHTNNSLQKRQGYPYDGEIIQG